MFSRASDRPQGTAGGHYLAAMVRVKDEARFLPEWIAHHLNLGVEHFYVYDNGSTDGTKEVLAPFVDSGVATYVPWPSPPHSRPAISIS